MNRLADTTAATLTTALQKLAEVGIDRTAFCETYDVPLYLVDGAVDGENPRACTALLVKALRLLRITYEGLTEPERNDQP